MIKLGHERINEKSIQAWEELGKVSDSLFGIRYTIGGKFIIRHYEFEVYNAIKRGLGELLTFIANEKGNYMIVIPKITKYINNPIKWGITMFFGGKEVTFRYTSKEQHDAYLQFLDDYFDVILPE